MGLRRALSPPFPAGELGVFYPLAGGADDSGAAQFDRLGPPAGRVAGSFSRNRRVLFSAMMELGRSARTLRPAPRGRGSSAQAPPDSQPEDGSPPCSLAAISGWRVGVLYPLAGGADDSGAAQFHRLGPPTGRIAGSFSRHRRVLFANDGARAIGVNAALRCEVGGLRRRRRPILQPEDGSPPCSLAAFSGWRVGVFFIPWRGVPPKSGAAQFDRLGPPTGRIAGSFSRHRRVLFSQ